VLVKKRHQVCGITVYTQEELSRIVAADREPLKAFGKLLGQHDIRGDLVQPFGVLGVCAVL